MIFPPPQLRYGFGGASVATAQGYALGTDIAFFNRLMLNGAAVEGETERERERERERESERERER